MEIVKREELMPRLQTGDARYACYSFEDLEPEHQEAFLKTRDEYEEKAPWSKTMKNVPHLKLDIPEFDFLQAKKEIDEHIDYMVPINMRTTEETERLGPDNHHSWSARAMVNYTPHDDKWFQKQSKECATRAFPEYQPHAHSIVDTAPRLNLEDMRYYKTPLFNKLKYITDYIFTNICDTTYRAFIWGMKHEGYLNWHNHARLPWHKDLITNDKAIVHIPIITDPKIRMLVEIEDVVYSEHYATGGTYVFNNIHDHAVENKSKVDRMHVAVFVPWHDKKFEEVLKRSYDKS